MPRARIRHELKTWPEFFEATRNGLKRFELRRDDRPEGFQVGDELLLREWNPHDKWCKVHFGAQCDCADYLPQGYTGREVLVRVDYAMSPSDFEVFTQGNNERLFNANYTGFVIMSVSLVN